MVPSFSDCISWFRTWTHVFTNLTTQIIQAAFDYSLVTLGGGGGRWVLFSGWLCGIHTVSGESEYMSSAAPFRGLIPWLPTPGSGLWWNGFRAKLRGFHSVQQKGKHLELVIQELAQAGHLCRLRRFMGNPQFEDVYKSCGPDEPSCSPPGGLLGSPRKPGCWAVEAISSDILDLAEEPVRRVVVGQPGSRVILR